MKTWRHLPLPFSSLPFCLFLIIRKVKLVLADLFVVNIARIVPLLQPYCTCVRKRTPAGTVINLRSGVDIRMSCTQIGGRREAEGVEGLSQGAKGFKHLKHEHRWVTLESLTRERGARRTNPRTLRSSNTNKLSVSSTLYCPCS